jgi:hypothetical protein
MTRSKSRKSLRFKSNKSIKHRSKALKSRSKSMKRRSKSMKRRSKSMKRGGGYISYTFDLNDRIKGNPAVIRVKR